MKILIVDDSQVNLRLLDKILSNVGYNVIQATNGADAVRAAKDAHPDLIILDIAMPGIDGIQAACILRNDAETKNIPIIFASSLIKRRRKRRTNTFLGSSFLPKPYNKTALLREIRGHLAHSRPHPAG
ncbi:MAG: response regulator [Clostridiales bacterium]|nr:response regulator [Clostridiales bacterium]